MIRAEYAVFHRTAPWFANVPLQIPDLSLGLACGLDGKPRLRPGPWQDSGIRGDSEDEVLAAWRARPATEREWQEVEVRLVPAPAAMAPTPELELELDKSRRRVAFLLGVLGRIGRSATTADAHRASERGYDEIADDSALAAHGTPEDWPGDVLPLEQRWSAHRASPPAELAPLRYKIAFLLGVLCRIGRSATVADAHRVSKRGHDDLGNGRFPGGAAGAGTTTPEWWGGDVLPFEKRWSACQGIDVPEPIRRAEVDSTGWATPEVARAKSPVRDAIRLPDGSYAAVLDRTDEGRVEGRLPDGAVVVLDGRSNGQRRRDDLVAARAEASGAAESADDLVTAIPSEPPADEPVETEPAVRARDKGLTPPLCSLPYSSLWGEIERISKMMGMAPPASADQVEDVGDALADTLAQLVECQRKLADARDSNHVFRARIADAAGLRHDATDDGIVAMVASGLHHQVDPGGAVSLPAGAPLQDGDALRPSGPLLHVEQARNAVELQRMVVRVLGLDESKLSGAALVAEVESFIVKASWRQDTLDRIATRLGRLPSTDAALTDRIADEVDHLVTSLAGHQQEAAVAMREQERLATLVGLPPLANAVDIREAVAGALRLKQEAEFYADRLRVQLDKLDPEHIEWLESRSMLATDLAVAVAVALDIPDGTPAEDRPRLVREATEQRRAAALRDPDLVVLYHAEARAYTAFRVASLAFEDSHKAFQQRQREHMEAVQQLGRAAAAEQRENMEDERARARLREAKERLREPR